MRDSLVHNGQFCRRGRVLYTRDSFIHDGQFCTGVGETPEQPLPKHKNVPLSYFTENDTFMYHFHEW